jgi:Ricin-type beta-trefoil lectin domain-like
VRGTTAGQSSGDYTDSVAAPALTLSETSQTNALNERGLNEQNFVEGHYCRQAVFQSPAGSRLPAERGISVNRYARAMTILAVLVATFAAFGSPATAAPAATATATGKNRAIAGDGVGPENVGDVVHLVNVNSGRCLTIAGGSTANNAAAVQFACDTHPSRRWTIVDAAGTGVQIRNVNSGRCLTIAGGSTANNAAAVQFTCDTHPSRRWL